MRPLCRLLLPGLTAMTMMTALVPGAASPHNLVPPELRDEGAPPGEVGIRAQPDVGILAHTPDAHSDNMSLLANVPKTHAAPDAPDFQSDLAFRGNLAFAGNYDGLKVIDISVPANSIQISHTDCFGNQATS